MSHVINVAGVTKTYAPRFGGLLGASRGGVKALRGVDMSVHRGSIFGLLGPNGAGKSTLVKILLTIIRPTTCTGTVLGAPVGDKAAIARVGYLPEHHRFPDYLTAAQVLDFYGALAMVPRAVRKARAKELLEVVGLSAWAKKPVKGFSKGMRQRLGIANALINDPELVVLDEPTDGVDPVGRRDIRNILAKLKEDGKTVFLNSHLLSELEMVCDRVAIMVQGLVTSQGTIEELTAESRRYEIDVSAAAPGFELTPAGICARLSGALAGVATLAPVSAAGGVSPPVAGTNGAAATSHGGTADQVVASGHLTDPERTSVSIEHRVTTGIASIRISTDNAITVQPLIDSLRTRGQVIRAVRPVRASLEDLFMQAVTDPTTGEVFAPGAQSDGYAPASARRTAGSAGVK